MTRVNREQRRQHGIKQHGPFASLPGFISNFMRMFVANKAKGVTVLTFAQWREKKWGGPCHSPANQEERFGYRVYIDQMSKIDDEPRTTEE